MPASADHPVELLRSYLRRDFADDLPVGVHAVTSWCRDPQFFPGATGLIDADSWADVQPGRAVNDDDLLPAPQGGALVIGNYQATLSSYRRLLEGSLDGFPRTWKVLRQLLMDIPPRDVFLTNAFIGLPDLAKDTAPFPTNRAFTRRCESLLTKELELFTPRVVICLGVAAAKMLARIADGLSSWRPWPGYTALTQRGERTVQSCRTGGTGGAAFTAVAVRHPSAVASKVDRDEDRALVSEAAGLTR